MCVLKSGQKRWAKAYHKGVPNNYFGKEGYIIPPAGRLSQLASV